jgi:hypothetical protein
MSKSIAFEFSTKEFNAGKVNSDMGGVPRKLFELRTILVTDLELPLQCVVFTEVKEIGIEGPTISSVTHDVIPKYGAKDPLGQGLQKKALSSLRPIKLYAAIVVLTASTTTFYG